MPQSGNDRFNERLPAQSESAEMTRLTGLVEALDAVHELAKHKLYQDGDHQAALELRHRQLELATELAECGDPDFARRGRCWLAGACSGIATTLAAMGHYKQAYPYFAKSDAIRKELIRTGSKIRQSRADGLRHWGFHQLNDPETSDAVAEQTLQQSYEMFVAAHKRGKLQHPWHLAEAAVCYLDALSARGKYKKAYSVCSDTLVILRSLPREKRFASLLEVVEKLSKRQDELRDKIPATFTQRLKPYFVSANGFVALSTSCVVVSIILTAVSQLSDIHPVALATLAAMLSSLVAIAVCPSPRQSLTLVGGSMVAAVSCVGLTHLSPLRLETTHPLLVGFVLGTFTLTFFWKFLWNKFLDSKAGKKCQTAFLLEKDHATVIVDRLASRIAEWVPILAKLVLEEPLARNPRFRPCLRDAFATTLAIGVLTTNPVCEFLVAPLETPAPTQLVRPTGCRAGPSTSSFFNHPWTSGRRWTPMLARRFTEADSLAA